MSEPATKDGVASPAATNNDILTALNSIAAGLATVQNQQVNQATALADLQAQASLTVAAATGLSARLTAVENGEKKVAAPEEKKDEDSADKLDYVPYFDGREENPFTLRPRGVSDRAAVGRAQGAPLIRCCTIGTTGYR
eukprot:SAG31_NODE_6596_length_1957_cov_1.726588_2_plen_139_part_00